VRSKCSNSRITGKAETTPLPVAANAGEEVQCRCSGGGQLSRSKMWMSEQYGSDASQKFTCPGVTAALRASVAVNDVGLPKDTVLTVSHPMLLPIWLSSARRRIAAASLRGRKARSPQSKVRHPSDKKTGEGTKIGGSNNWALRTCTRKSPELMRQGYPEART
jgi:hypothetical protein